MLMITAASLEEEKQSDDEVGVHRESESGSPVVHLHSSNSAASPAPLLGKLHQDASERLL